MCRLTEKQKKEVEQIINENYKFIEGIANKFYRKNNGRILFNDYMQEALYSVIPAYLNFNKDKGKKFTHYLARVVYNHLLSHSKSNPILLRSIDDYYNSVWYCPDLDTNLMLEDIMNLLDEKDLVYIRLYLSGLNISQMARSLGVASETVRQRFKRIIAKLNEPEMVDSSSDI